MKKENEFFLYDGQTCDKRILDDSVHKTRFTDLVEMYEEDDE